MTSSAQLETIIQSLAKAALLEVETAKKDAAADIKLFLATLSTYSTLRQIPIFFVKFFSYGTTIIINKDSILNRGQIVPQILQTCAKCFNEMPPGQTLELCDIFNETLNSWRKLAFHSHDSSGALFYVSQLYSTLLLHARLFHDGVPTSTFSHVERKIQGLNETLEEMSCIFIDTDTKASPYHSSVLLMCYAVSEIKLAYNVTCKSSQIEFPTSESHRKALDFSLLHESLNDELIKVFSHYFGAEDKCRVYCLVQLLMQKLRVLKMKGNLTFDEEAHFQQIIIFLLLLFNSLNNENFSDWDRDLSTLDAKNYGTAVWDSFFRIYPQIYNSLTCQQSHGLCTLMLNRYFKPPISVQRNQNVVQIKLLMHDIFKSEFCQESADLQSCITTCTWERAYTVLTSRRTKVKDTDPIDPQAILFSLGSFNADLVKLNSTTPKSKSDAELNDLWKALEKISLKFNQFMQSSEPLKQIVKVASCRELIKAFEYLSLEALLPGNQVKCLIGFSVLFLSLPEQDNDPKATELAMNLIRLMLCVFDGSQKICLFHFVDSNLYLQAVIKKLDDLKLSTADNNDVIKRFLKHLIRLLTIEAKMLLSLEEVFYKLGENMTESISSAMTILVLLHRVSHTLQNRPNRNKLTQFCEKLTYSMHSKLVLSLKSKCVPDTQCYFYGLQLSSYTEIISLIPLLSLDNKEDWLEVIPHAFDTSLQLLNSNEEKEVTHLFKFFGKLCSNHVKLFSYLPHNFIGIIWQGMCAYLKRKLRKLQNQMKGSQSSEHPSKKIKTDSTNPAHVCPKYCYPLHQNSSQTMSLTSLNGSETKLFHLISTFSSESELTEIFNSLHSEMETLAVDMSRFDFVTFQVNLMTVRYLFQPHVELKQPFASQLLQNILTSLLFIANQACGSQHCVLAIRVPLLHFFQRVFIEDKVKLVGHLSLQSLHLCADAGLQNLATNTALFVKVYHAIADLMFGLSFVHHTTVLNEKAAFFAIVSMMMKSVIHASNQTILDRHTPELRFEVELCVLSLLKLLLYLSDNKLEFAKLAPYLIADYVDCVQNITVHSSVKGQLLIGIDYLLKLCSEESLHMLSANLKDSCLEIYNNLVRNFKHYDQFA